MFYYYGSKRQMAAAYAPPRHPVIVEPFAGAAAYSVRYLGSELVKKIILVEKDPRVVELWDRLMSMTANEIASLPIPEAGDDTSDFFYMTSATSNAIAGCRRMTVTKRMPRIIGSMLLQIPAIIDLVREKIEVIQGDYASAPDVEATWFIDPPYQVTGVSATGNTRPQGMGYAKGCTSKDIDYAALGDWCTSRRGQVIVCEQFGATWLPFRSLGSTFNSIGLSLKEVVWTNDRDAPGVFIYDAVERLNDEWVLLHGGVSSRIVHRGCIGL